MTPKGEPEPDFLRCTVLWYVRIALNSVSDGVGPGNEVTTLFSPYIFERPWPD